MTDIRRYLVFALVSLSVHALALSGFEHENEQTMLAPAYPQQAVTLQLLASSAVAPEREQHRVIEPPQAKNVTKQPVKEPVTQPRQQAPKVAKKKVPSAAPPHPVVNHKQANKTEPETTQERALADNKELPADKPNESSHPVSPVVTPQPHQPPQSQNDPVTAQQASMPQLVETPQFRTRPAPIPYPRLARRRNIEGETLVEVWLNKKGEQIKRLIIASSGYDMLDTAAVKAIARWQFEGNPGVTSRGYRVRIPVKFKLD